MFATYNYSASATLANIIKDLGDMLTGTTDKTALSAGCDQANTTISAAYDVAGWAVYDAAANSAGALTSPYFDATADTCVKNSHGLSDGEPVNYTLSSGSLPPELAANTTYYARNPTTNNFQLSATPTGAIIDLSTAGSASAATLWTGRKQVFRAACVGAASLYKYAMLDYATAGYIGLTLLENWAITSSSKTATNQTAALATTGANAGAQRTTIGAGGVVRISASARRMIFQSTVSAGTGAETNNCWMGVLERSRKSPWDSVAAGYLPAIATSGFLLFTPDSGTNRNSLACRYKTPSGDVTAAAGTALLITMLSGWVSNTGYGSWGPVAASAGVQKYKVPDGVGGLYCPFSEIVVGSSANAFPGGSVSEVSDVWVPPAYSNLDKVVYNGKTYVFLQNASLTAFGCTVVPAG